MDNGGEIRPVPLISGDGNYNDVGMDDFANKVKMNESGISYSVVSIMGPQSSNNRGEIRPVQLISGDGNFNDVGMDDFANKVKMNEWGISYSVISIMGPQSSGKSTLLNHLYGTKFREMDANEGRKQTTQGIWLAYGIGMEHHTLVMDLEGTDGIERGEDDTAFERRSALFALAVSDVLLVNMWCTDVGRCHTGNIPLLRTVFQVMLELSIPRKTTLIFVLRDQTKSPLEMLDLRLRQDIERLWNSIPRPQAHQDAPLTNFFNVEVEALISFELSEVQFDQQVNIIFANSSLAKSDPLNDCKKP